MNYLNCGNEFEKKDKPDKCINKSDRQKAMERYDSIVVANSQVFAKGRSVALWSATKKGPYTATVRQLTWRTIKEQKLGKHEIVLDTSIRNTPQIR